MAKCIPLYCAGIKNAGKWASERTKKISRGRFYKRKYVLVLTVVNKW